MTGHAHVTRGDARHLPLPDGSVDLIVTSPPYFGLRSYTDDGQHYEGQIGGEATPQEYLASLLECTREWMRVLKPAGSIFVNLGDKYSQRVATRPSSHQDGLFPDRPELRKDWKRDRATGLARMPAENVINGTGQSVREKSLMGLPWRYALACTDQLGLILRSDVIWSKANGLPESVTDRVRRSHEYVFHFTKQARYYSAVDEIRETYQASTISRNQHERKPHTPDGYTDVSRGVLRDSRHAGHKANPLGKLPGSVWQIATQPLNVPDGLGVDHFAAYPCELPRRIILGWSPRAVCTVCGEGRRPVVERPGLLGGDNNTERRVDGSYFASGINGGQKNWQRRMAQPDRITGYACACTPHTDHPERRQPSVTPSRRLGRGHQDNDLRADAAGTRHHGNDWPQREPTRDYHLAGWTPPPARPGLVVDPFGGTGTTALVASMLGRDAVTVDRSADYCRLAAWRVADPGERARAAGVPKPPPVLDGQVPLFGLDGDPA